LLLFLLFSHKGVGGILMWGFWDKAHWRPNAAIVNGDNFELNAAGAAYIKLYHETFRFNFFDLIVTL
jgi:endo-1,4-beta-xylanase